jgi:predicted NBD/HSP70 family sugar kinase
MVRAPVVGKPYLLREINEQAVLDVLRKHGPLSRTALTARLALSKSTVSSVAAALVARRLVKERPARTRRIGRRPILLEINPDAGYVVGADLGATLLRVASADLTGQIRTTVQDRTAAAGLETLLAQVETMVERVAADTTVRRRKSLAFAVGVPGAVAGGEEIRLCPNLPFLEGVRLRERLATRLRIPVLMDNDVNFAAVGEKWRGRAGDVHNFASIAIGTGVGMGLIINGELYRGTTGFAGEIGYLPLPMNGTYVPVERLIAGPAIARRGRERSSLSSSEAVFAAAARGDARALGIVREVAKAVAWTIACVNVSLDLKLVVIGGGVGGNVDLLLPQIREHLRQMVPFAPEVAPSALHGRAALYGAVAVALRSGRALAGGGRR